MAGTVWQVVKVEVGFGDAPFETSPTWVDISNYVRLVDQVTWKRGSNPETGEPEPGRLSFVVNNDGGDFTPGATGAFGEVRNRLPVRISVMGLDTAASGTALAFNAPVMFNAGLGFNAADFESLTLWTGTVETWAQQWTGGVRAAVSVTGIDRWARLQRRRLPADRIAYILDALEPSRFYPMTDVALTGFADSEVTSWGLQPSASISAVANPQGESLPGVAALPSGVQFNSVWRGSGATPSLSTYAGGVTVAAWVSTPSTVVAYPGALGVRIGETDTDALDISIAHNAILAQEFGGGSPLTTAALSLSSSSAWRHIAVSAVRTGGTTTVQVWINGALVLTQTGAAAGVWEPLGTVRLSAGVDPGETVAHLGYLGVFDRVLTGDEVRTLYDAAISTAETADARAERIADLDGGWPVSVVGTPTVLMSSQDLAEKSPAQALLECAQADGGTVFMDADGWPVIAARSHRHTLDSAATIPLHCLDRELTFTLDDQNLINRVTASRMVGTEQAAQVIRENAASVATFDRQETSVDLWVRDDADLLDIAQGLANRNAVPQVRSETVTVDLYTMAASVDVPALLALNPGDRIEITDLPDGSPLTTIPMWVEQVGGTVSDKAFRLTLTVSPVVPNRMFTDEGHTTNDGYTVGF